MILISEFPNITYANRDTVLPAGFREKEFVLTDAMMTTPPSMKTSTEAPYQILSAYPSQTSCSIVELRPASASMPKTCPASGLDSFKKRQHWVHSPNLKLLLVDQELDFGK